MSGLHDVHGQGRRRRRGRHQRLGRLPGLRGRDQGVRLGHPDRRQPDRHRQRHVTGRTALQLVVTNGGDNIDYDHADWADAKLTCGGRRRPPPPGLSFAAPVSLPAGTQHAWRRDGRPQRRRQARSGGRERRLEHRERLARQRQCDVRRANQLRDRPDAEDGRGRRPERGRQARPHQRQPGRIDGQRPPRERRGRVRGQGRLPGRARARTRRRSATSMATASSTSSLACWGGSVISVLLGNGDGTLRPKVDYAAGAAPHSVVLGRFDGDAILDAAVANHDGNTVSVLRGNGDGTFQPQVTYAVGTGPHSLRAGDLNGDGRIDLVSANEFSNSVSVLLGNGDGTFAAAVSYPAGPVPKGVAIADVSGDGKPDVLAADTAGNYPVCCNPGGNQVSILLGSGTGTLSAPTSFTRRHDAVRDRDGRPRRRRPDRRRDRGLGRQRRHDPAEHHQRRSAAGYHAADGGQHHPGQRRDRPAGERRPDGHVQRGARPDVGHDDQRDPASSRAPRRRSRRRSPTPPRPSRRPSPRARP